MNRYFKILLFLVLISSFITCKKRKEDLIKGKWERVFIENPNILDAEIWEFKDNSKLEIIRIDKASGIEKSNSKMSYNIENSKKMKIWFTDYPDNIEVYDLIKVNKRMMRIIKMDGKIDAWNHEFTRINE